MRAFTPADVKTGTLVKMDGAIGVITEIKRSIRINLKSDRLPEEVIKHLSISWLHEASQTTLTEITNGDLEDSLKVCTFDEALAFIHASPPPPLAEAECRAFRHTTRALLGWAIGKAI